MKKIIFIFITLFFALSANSRNNSQTGNDSLRIENQDSLKEKRHEISIGIGGGYSSLKYQPTVGDYKYGLGGNVSVGYTYLFKPNWGIVTGLEFALYNAKTQFTNHSDRYVAIDDENKYNQLTLIVESMNNFEEKQQAYYLNIPLMLQYQSNGDNTNKFYAAVGGKLGIPVQCKYNSVGDYVTKGKYAFTESIFEDQPEHGFYTYKGLQEDGKLKLNLNFQLSGELGYKWLVAEDKYLYTGVYCDYGLTDIRKTKDSPKNVLQYNNDNLPGYTVNSILESHYTNDKGTFNYVKKVNTLSFGLKVRLAFKLD